MNDVLLLLGLAMPLVVGAWLGRKMLPNMPPEAIAQQLSFLASDDALPIPNAAARQN